MKLWQKLWLLFAAIWVVVAGLNVATILAFSEEPAAKVTLPVLAAVVVPAAAYLFGWIWERLTRKKSGSEPDFPEK